MCRGVKISGVNCKKPHFRRYFQSLPSRVYRGETTQTANSVRRRAENVHRLHYHFETRLEH